MENHQFITLWIDHRCKTFPSRPRQNSYPKYGEFLCVCLFCCQSHLLFFKAQEIILQTFSIFEIMFSSWCMKEKKLPIFDIRKKDDTQQSQSQSRCQSRSKVVKHKLKCSTSHWLGCIIYTCKTHAEYRLANLYTNSKENKKTKYGFTRRMTQWICTNRRRSTPNLAILQQPNGEVCFILYFA